MKITNQDGIDITEAVQILYDIAHSSMDWGSGMLDNAEMETVIRLAQVMGWQVPDLPYNTSALVGVAEKFPELYEVVPRMRLAHSLDCTTYSSQASKYNSAKDADCCVGREVENGFEIKTRGKK